MRNVPIAAVVLLLLGPVTGWAQSPGARPGHEPGVGESDPLSNKAGNIATLGSASGVVPRLPPPGIGVNGTPDDYLMVARAAVLAGRSGQAQEALEMAETRMLGRDVAAEQIGYPNGNTRIARVSDARHALGAGDKANAVRLIDLALVR